MHFFNTGNDTGDRAGVEARVQEQSLFAQDEAWEQDQARNDEEPVQLPRSSQRRYLTFFTALTMVIAAASCILVLVLLRTQQASSAASDARDAALQDQLTAIEASLGSIDQSVMDSDATAAGTAASYAALGSTVDSLRTNLTDYRDNNDIQNVEISEHLDSVIAQLDKIKEDMAAAQEESSAQGDVLGTRLDSITQESAQGNTNLAKELETVHGSISALIDKADNTQDGNYKELKGILTATDSSLSSLVRAKFDETGSLITSNISSLRGSVDSVDKNVQGISSSVSTGLSDVRKSLETVNTDLTNLNTGLTTNLTTLGTNLTGVSTEVTGLKDQLSQTDASLVIIAAGLDEALESLDQISDERLTGMQDALQTDLRKVQEQVAALRSAIGGEAGGEDEITLADLGEALEDLHEDTEILDKKIGRILEHLGIQDPTGESGGDGGDESGAGGETGSGGDESGTGGETGSGGDQPGTGETGGGDQGSTEPGSSGSGTTPQEGSGSYESGSAEVSTE